MNNIMNTEMNNHKKDGARWDHELIIELVTPGSRVLDLGCGDGELLARLEIEKRVSGQGVDADPARVAEAVTRGVPVYQGDLDRGLAEFDTGSFDYVILEKTLQTVRRPMVVLEEMLRIGRLCMVSFPNFNHYQVVERLLETGRMPVTSALPYQWFDTPNIHLFTLYDFLDWAGRHRVDMVKGFAGNGSGYRPLALPADSKEAAELLFLLRRSETDNNIGRAVSPAGLSSKPKTIHTGSVQDEDSQKCD